MTVVDPRLAQIPVELQDTFEKRVYFEELERFLHDIWVRTGGGNDAIQDESIKELYPWVPKTEDDKIETNLFAAPFNGDRLGVQTVVTTAVDYTTQGNEIIICTNSTPITITMNATPEDLEHVNILTGTGQVSMISSLGINGKTTSVSLLGNYAAPHLIFTIDAGEYRIA